MNSSISAKLPGGPRWRVPEVVRDRLGLGWLAKRDRSLSNVLRGRWSSALRSPAERHTWRNVAGRITRQLLRNLEHTDAVYGFMAGLVASTRAEGWEVVQLDPAFRASRYFTYDGRHYAVLPDAFGIVRQESRLRPFFLEWERRAVRPVTMIERLAPYLRYYSTHRPTDDHGEQPLLLVLLQDNIGAIHFQRVAESEMKRYRVQVPMVAASAGSTHLVLPFVDR